MIYQRLLFLLSLLMIISTEMPAQLCQGSLGNPLVNVTFGSGANPGPPLRAASTNYQYTATDCPNDGFYTVRSRTDRCFTNWHSLPSDHTGDAGGYFMLVNASFAPGAFYLDTVDLACSNTTYEFAAWVLNVNSPIECSGNPIKPNLTFLIEKTDGALLQSYNTGDLPPQSSALWRQVGFLFTTPSFVNRVVLKIRNNAAGGCGNDLALDDITFRPCGPKVSIAANNSSSTVNLCQGIDEQVRLSGSVSPGFDNPFLQWQRSGDNGQTWIDIAGANSTTLVQPFPSTTPLGTYQYRMGATRMENRSVTGCQVFSDPMTVRINARPAITLQANSPLCERQTLTLSATGGSQYSWRSTNGFTASGATTSITSVTPAQSGWYVVTGVSDVGCTATDSVAVIIHDAPTAQTDKKEYEICEGSSVPLLASGGDTYLWSPAAGLNSPSIAAPIASPTMTSGYTVVVRNPQGCTDSTTVLVKVHTKPKVDAGPDKEIAVGTSTVLSGAVTGTAINYAWTPLIAINDATKLQPTVSPLQDQLYTLTATSTLGCGTASDSVQVAVFKGVFIPTAFTPNGDGRNDAWRVAGLSIYSSYETLIFNRYGQVVYRAKNKTPLWDGTIDGKPVPTGNYPYLIRITGEKKVFKGLITLIR